MQTSDLGFPSDFGLRASDFRAAGFALSLTIVTLEQPWGSSVNFLIGVARLLII
jgi:hypothetical protein